MSPLPTSRGAKAFPWTATNRYPCAAAPRLAMAALVSWYGRWRNNEITRVAAEPRVKTVQLSFADIVPKRQSLHGLNQE